MVLCKCGCGRDVVTPATGRPGEYYSASCRKRAQRQRERALQPELISLDVTKPDEDTSTVAQEVTKLPDVPVEIVQDVTKPDTPECWTVYRNRDQQCDAYRRTWLQTWGQGHDVQRGYWFTMWGRYSGFYQVHTLPGKWADFVEDAGAFEIYCLFVAVLTPRVPLEQYLEDAAKRGEIKGLVTKG